MRCIMWSVLFSRTYVLNTIIHIILTFVNFWNAEKRIEYCGFLCKNAHSCINTLSQIDDFNLFEDSACAASHCGIRSKKQPF